MNPARYALIGAIVGIIVTAAITVAAAPFIFGVERQLAWTHLTVDPRQEWFEYHVNDDDVWSRAEIVVSAKRTRSSRDREWLARVRLRPGRHKLVLRACNKDACSDTTTLDAIVPWEWPFK